MEIFPQRTYICIDLKSYYASVECVYRGLDPLKANLLVADENRSDQTICLAVSPSLKAMGVPSRPRLFEAKWAIRKYEREHNTKVEYITAVPRMAEYERISAQIYGIYLRYVAPEDVHVYSIDECFIDWYLPLCFSLLIAYHTSKIFPYNSRQLGTFCPKVAQPSTSLFAYMGGVIILVGGQPINFYRR